MNKVCLIFPTAESRDHWNTQRTFKRAGLDNAEFTAFTTKDDAVLGKLNDGEFDFALVFGEQALYDVLGHSDITRWFNRRVPLRLQKRTVICVPCIEPMRLLARRYDEDEQEGRKKRGMRHPPRFTGAVVDCIKKTLQLPYVPPMKTDYLCDPSPIRFEQWVDEFEAACVHDDALMLSWDIETPYKINEDDEEEMEEKRREVEKIILRISFSYREGHAVSVPHTPEYKRGIQRLLGYKGIHITWNGIQFDVPVTEANGYSIAGLVWDGMDAFHLLQTDLDKGLEAVSGLATDLMPWKHLSDVDPALYSCIDSDAALRNVIWIFDRLRNNGLFDRFVREMEIIKFLNEAGKRGNKVDEQFRLELKAELEALLYDMLRSAQPLVDPKFHRRKMYVRLPKNTDPGEWQMVMLPKAVTMCNQCGKLRVSTKHKCPDGHEWEKTKTIIKSENFYRLDPFKAVTDLESLLTVLKVSGFNPCSSNQMLTYMKKNRHPVGTNFKTKNDTADVKHLQKLVKKYGGVHPIYSHTLKIRLLQKALSTYVNGLAPDQNGYMHCTYVNSPSTWRLGARNINVQNLGKRNGNPYAKKARKIIIPSLDHVLVNADSSAIEAVFVGKFMEDDEYILEARKGIHAGLCCNWLKIEPTAENRDKVKKEQPALYDQIKTVVHGTSFGMGPYMMHMNDPEKFPTTKVAEELQDFLFKRMPTLPKWHHQLRVTVKKNGYLTNPWGLRHYFYDVFTYAHDEDGKLIINEETGLPKVKLGKDGKRVIAFQPQSSAGMFMRDNIYLLAQTELRQYMPAVVSIHDGYCVDVPYHLKDTAADILGDILTRPIPELGGLQVGCEIEYSSKNFLDMEKIKKIEIGV